MGKVDYRQYLKSKILEKMPNLDKILSRYKVTDNKKMCELYGIKSAEIVSDISGGASLHLRRLKKLEKDGLVVSLPFGRRHIWFPVGVFGQ